MEQQGIDVFKLDMSQLGGLLGGLQSDSGLNSKKQFIQTRSNIPFTDVFGNSIGAWAGRLVEVWRANEIGIMTHFIFALVISVS